MFKRLLGIGIMGGGVLVLFSGCAFTSGSPVMGVFYNGTKFNQDYTADALYDLENNKGGATTARATASSGLASKGGATKKTKATKKGRASCYSVLGIVATGDCTVEAAAKEGGITKIHNVSNETFRVLGFYGSYTTIVTGE